MRLPKTPSLAIAVIVCALLVWANPASAQTGATGQTGGSGTTGSTRTTGTTGTTGTSGTSSLTGSTATQGLTGGGSGGSTGQLQTASPVGNEPTFNTGDGSLGAQVGQGFTGRQNTGFVGNRNASTQGQNGAMSQMFNQMFGNLGSDPNANRNTSTSNSVKRARPQQRIAFTYPRVNLTQSQVKMTDRIGRLAKVKGGTAIISDEGVATLTGTVGSEDDRKLAEAMARLEPGVRSVKNELQVSAGSPAAP